MTIFSDCHRSFPVDPFDHHTTSTFAIVFEASIPRTLHRPPRLRIITSVKDYFSLSLCTNVCPVVSLPIVFSVDTFRKIVDFRSSTGYLLFPPGMQCLLYLAGSPSVLVSQRTSTIDPFARHISVPACANVDGGICGSQVPRCHIFDILSHSSAVYGGQFHSVKGERNEWVLIIKCTLHFSCSHPFFCTCPFCSHFIPHVPTIVPLPLVLPSFMILTITFHHFSL